MAPGGLIGQIGLRNSRDIAACRLGPERHRAVEPNGDFGLLIAHQIFAEIRRDLDRDLQLAALQTMFEFVLAGDVRMLSEIPGSR